MNKPKKKPECILRQMKIEIQLSKSVGSRKSSSKWNSFFLAIQLSLKEQEKSQTT